jgi:hypothetical protein
VVRFRTRREDFAVNAEKLRIQHALLYFARSEGKTFEVENVDLRFAEEGGDANIGGAASSNEGVISTRRGNAGSWAALQGKSPVGEWRLTVPNTELMRRRLKSRDITDVLLVVTYSGRLAAWPT